MAERTWDERDVRIRPGRGSRPRSKQRPAHADAIQGFVTTVDRGRYTTVVDGRVVVAVKARELGRGRVVPGDQVDLVGDISGGPGTLARIVRISPRRTVLRRTADDSDPSERVIVANADQLVVVTALAEPEPRTRMIDRCVVAAYAAGMDAVLLLTKADLASPDTLIDLYAATGVAAVVTARTDDGHISGLDEIRDVLAGRITVFIGHSGVGKSTLVNALVPGAARATGHVNTVTGRGRHTSTSAVALSVPGSEPGTWVIDTPGVRSFGLAHVDPAHLLAAFTDLADVATASCPRGCTHLADSPDCALDEWVEGAGTVGHSRLDSFRRLLISRLSTDDLG